MRRRKDAGGRARYSAGVHAAAAATESQWKWAGHPLWLVGFRPFFALATLSAVSLPLLWVLVLSGVLTPAAPFSVVQWHAHEMFFGFGFAVLGGFLLTATKNWVQVRGYYGPALQALVAAWLFERAGMWFGGAWPRPLFLLSNHLFLATLAAMIGWTLVRHRATDSYRDNAIFVVVLAAFVLAKVLVLSPQHFVAGRTVALALFRVAFVVMLERTLTQFMKAIFKVQVPRWAALDAAVKALALLLVAAPLLPRAVEAGAALLLAALLTGRFLAWSPHLALRRLDVGVMYLGGFALAAQLVLEALEAVAHVAWVGAAAVHTFTFGTMGLIIPAMITRVAKGHTGRPPVFDRFDQAALWVMLAGFVARVVLPQLAPAEYRTWVWAAALCWSLGFGLVAWRTLPLLLRPRVDGREH